MRMSQGFGKTLREAPADAEMTSHQLLIRANYVRPLGAGIYTFMPLGYRVIRKIWDIMSDELDAIGGQEMWMPNMHPATIWQTSGRWIEMDPILMKLKSPGGRDFVMSPTHEEVVNEITLTDIESYRDLPRMVYHITKKFRDEPRARGGLIRLREFLMKDAYTLDPSEESLNESYPNLYQAYINIFDRCDVPSVPILADVGAMGGTSSHEFAVPHSQGEDIFIACENCDYAANVEVAEFVREGEKPEVLDDIAKVATPNCTTIRDVADYVGVPISQTVKAVFYWFTKLGQPEKDGRFIFGLVRGDLDVNEVKLINALGGGQIRPATEEEILASGGVPGYASAVGLNVAAGLEEPGITVVADYSIEKGGNFVVGANDEGYHFTGINYPRDFKITLMADIAQADEGHKCPQCGGRIESVRAIEVGHCFKLGTRFSEASGATYLDENNEPQLIHMGSYGIGLDRLMAVIVELHHDGDGIIWPANVAPFQVHLMHLGKKEGTKEAAEKIYTELRSAGIEVYFDDRDASAGVKFKDADLIGIPQIVVVGERNLAEGSIEVKQRSTGERQKIALKELVAYLRNA